MGARIVGLTSLALLATATAHADAVPNEPDDCPRGAQGVSTHAGTWCEAATCATDADCAHTAGHTCREASLCVRTEEYVLGGRIAHQPGQPPPRGTRHVAVSTCEGGCPADAPCLTARRCVAPTLVEMFTGGPSADAGGGGGCGCAAGGDRRGVLAGYALTALAALLVLRAAAARRPR